MQRHELMALLGQLKLAGMRAHFDEVVTAGRKRQRAFEVILGMFFVFAASADWIIERHRAVDFV